MWVLNVVPLDFRLLSVLFGASLLVIVCFFDDRYELSPYLRLAVQGVAVLMPVLAGVGIEGIASPFGDFIPLNEYKSIFSIFGYSFEIVWLADLVVIFWVLVLINTLNWLDGLPGLVSGVSSIGFLVLFLLSLGSWHVIDQTQVSYLSLILAVLAISFLFFDFPAPRMLLGDSGSMFFGYMLAILSIYAGGKLATTFLILGLPILDVIWVICRRMFVEKRSPMRGDLRHFHHRLIKAGLTQRQALVLIYCVCILFGFAALFLSSFTKLLAIFFLLVCMTGLALWVIGREKE